MAEFKGKLTFVRRAVMTTEIETFSQCTVVLVAALTLMQGIVVYGTVYLHASCLGLKTFLSIWPKNKIH